MKAKFIYEAMDDILKGKSEEDIQKEIEKMSYEDYDYEMLKAIYPYNRWNRITNKKQFRRKLKKIADQGFKDKKDPREVAKEIADTFEQIYETMGDVLKGKSKEDIISSLENTNLKPNELLIKSAKVGFLPGVKKALKMGADVHSYKFDYALHLASENGHLDIVELLIKNGAEKAKLNEMAFSDINMNDIINKDTLNIWMGDDFKNELFMYSYAQEHGLDPEKMEVNEWIDTKEASEWIKYEIESRFYETINKFHYEVIQGSRIQIWRKMTVSDNWFEHIQKEGKRLGIYWSWNPEAAEEHHGYNTDKKDLVCISSSVKVDEVDWIKTIRLNMDPVAEEEKEIRLFKNTPLKIESLEINNEEIDINLIKDKIFKA